MVIANADAPVKGQLMQYVLRGMSDGGYWTEAADLVEKYGVVPKQVQPETYQSGHTDCFVSTLNRLLRKDAMELRELVKTGKDPYARKAEMLEEVYRAECIAFGEPVRTFDFTYRDKDNNFHEDRGLSPLDFYHKYVGISLNDYMAVINEPTFDKPLGRVIAFHGVENMVGRDMRGLNLTGHDMEDLCVKQLKAGEAVWFACDAGAAGARKEGVWDPESVRYEDLLGGFSMDMEKESASNTVPAPPPTPCLSPVCTWMKKEIRTAGKSKTPGARTWGTTGTLCAQKLISKNLCMKQ